MHSTSESVNLTNPDYLDYTDGGRLLLVFVYVKFNLVSGHKTWGDSLVSYTVCVYVKFKLVSGHKTWGDSLVSNIVYVYVKFNIIHFTSFYI